LNKLVSQNLVQISSDREDSLWNAVKSRDPRYDLQFVYGVKSTRIFCRPTCPSRKPKSRNQVSFFESSIQAKDAGFRPCERCKPDEADFQNQSQTIQKLCEFINEYSGEKLTLERLSRESGMSPFHLQRTFKKIVGVTPREYTEAVRMDHLKMGLRSGNSVRRSTYDAGYNTSGWLYFRPNEKLGMSPSKYKNGAEGLRIDYAISTTPLGKLLVASTNRGVCFVTLGDSDQKLLALLRAEYPKAKFEDSSECQNKGLCFSLEKITDYITKGTDLENSNLPLDLHATAFQWRVWKELRQIPYGSVRSYSEVAKKIGLPKATRAVANACAANPVPLVIPCHRVVPKTGGVGNYGLGVERKKALLEKEGVDLGNLTLKE
jgi:AraC family transcriptional regulator, regulatory protein of adaptative response / methylated-DNA-[protein]-cysteine methyltransferase